MKIRPERRREQYFIVPMHREEERGAGEYNDVTKYLGPDGEEIEAPKKEFRTSPLPITLMSLKEAAIELRERGDEEIVTTSISHGGANFSTFQVPRYVFEKYMEHLEQVPLAFTPYHRIGRNGKVTIYTVRKQSRLKLKTWLKDGTILPAAELLKRQRHG